VIDRDEHPDRYTESAPVPGLNPQIPLPLIHTTMMPRHHRNVHHTFVTAGCKGVHEAELFQ